MERSRVFLQALTFQKNDLQVKRSDASPCPPSHHQVLLVAAIMLLVPRSSPLLYEKTHSLTELRHKGASESAGGTRYAVVLDAGSTGSRVHVFKFELVANKPGELKLISDTFEQLKPGLSSFPDSPEQAAASLKPLLDTALKTVPADLQVSNWSHDAAPSLSQACYLHDHAHDSPTVFFWAFRHMRSGQCYIKFSTCIGIFVLKNTCMQSSDAACFPISDASYH